MSPTFAELAALSRPGQPPFVLATVVATGGSTPRLAGARMVITPSDQQGTIGGGAFEHHVIQQARALLADPIRTVASVEVHLVQDLGMCCGGKMTAFLEQIAPPPRLWIFGAGHVAAALAPLVVALDIDLCVVDERAAWADPARFPASARVIDADPLDHLRREPPGPTDHVLVVTHDHALDEAIIRALAPHPLAWLGLVGSRGKWARFRRRLAARDLPAPALDRVRCPVGLDLGAVTPAEIAVSIAADLVATRRAHPTAAPSPDAVCAPDAP